MQDTEMWAMILEKVGHPLRLAKCPIPSPARGQILLRVAACAVCRTDLHVLDGELSSPKLPLILGHQIVGEIIEMGEGVERFSIGDRLGVPWLGWTCGECPFCRSGQENLCDAARFTGYQIDGGYAQYTVADERFCFPIPDGYSSEDAAPLLCAGLIGYRALRMTGEAKRVGFYGFGSAAHLILQAARHQSRQVFAFTRSGDNLTQRNAIESGAVWAGGSDQAAPEPLDAAIIFASAGELIPVSLRSVAKGGTVVCAGIHMSDIPSFPYDLLWGERVLRSVANLTRRDGDEFLTLAPQIPIRPQSHIYPLEAANEALRALRQGRIQGTAVLIP